MAFGSRLTTAHCMLAAFLLLELVHLLVPKPFYVDWVNHVWILEYYTQYLREHWTFPPTINVEQGFGNPMPLFYGIFFYPLLAFASLLTGADLALRLCFAVLLMAPVGACYVLYQSLLKNTVLAIYLSISTNFSIYQLTNLYSRGALTEFFAYQLILLGTLISYHALLNKTKISDALFAFGFACFVFAMGAHPVTLYLFCIFVCPIIVIYIFNHRSDFGNFSTLKLLFFSMSSMIILIPWLINTMIYQKILKITNSKLHYFPQSIDSLWAKIGFFYLDQRVLDGGIFGTPTPFLDAPLPLILMTIVAFNCYYICQFKNIKILKYIMPLVVVLSVLFMGIIPPESGLSGPWENSIYVTSEHSLLHRLLMSIQFAYRLSGTLSLCLVVTSIFFVHFIAGLTDDITFRKNFTTLVYATSLLAVLSNAQKLAEIYLEYIKAPEIIIATSPVILDDYIDARVLLIKPSEYQSITKDTSRYPFTFYGSRAYTMPQLYRARSELDDTGRQIIPLLVRDYGKEMRVDCERNCLLQTNIVPTTLHRVLIDGREPEKPFLAMTENLDFELPAGEHVIRVDLVGDYVRPIIISIWVALGLLCLVVIHAMVVIGGEVRARRNLLVG